MTSINENTTIKELLYSIEENATIINTPIIFKLYTALTKAQQYNENTNNEYSDDEEGMPPDTLQSSHEQYHENILLATQAFENKDYTNALQYIEKCMAFNPNSAKALRIRSQIYWKINNVKQAYEDMCEAQKLDFHEDFNSLHITMQSYLKNKTNNNLNETNNTNNNINNTNNTNNNINDILQNQNFANMAQNLMSNPQTMKMAQDLMQNPETMQQMLNMFTTKK